MIAAIGNGAAFARAVSLQPGRCGSARALDRRQAETSRHQQARQQLSAQDCSCRAHGQFCSSETSSLPA